MTGSNRNTKEDDHTGSSPTDRALLNKSNQHRCCCMLIRNGDWIASSGFMACSHSPFMMREFRTNLSFTWLGIASASSRGIFPGLPLGNGICFQDTGHCGSSGRYTRHGPHGFLALSYVHCNARIPHTLSRRFQAARGAHADYPA